MNVDNTTQRPEPGTAAATQEVLPPAFTHPQPGVRSFVVPGAVSTDRALVVVLLSLLVISSMVLGGLAYWIIDSNLFEPGPDKNQWIVEITGASDLHEDGLDGSGIEICIVDSGIDLSHSAFDGAAITFRDFLGSATTAYDDQGHGTAMASLIVGHGNGLAAMAPGVSLRIAKAINPAGFGDDLDIAAAIDWCSDPDGNGDYSDGSDIISLSLGGGGGFSSGGQESEAERAVDRATSHGIYVVAAAGNDGDSASTGIPDLDVGPPGNRVDVITVGAISRDGTDWVIADFSSRGSTLGRSDPDLKPEVVAPGVDIRVAVPGQQWAAVDGTSPATAIAAGGLALLLEGHPDLVDRDDNGQVRILKQVLMNSSEVHPDQDLPHDDHYGYGLLRLDLLAADL